MVNSVNLSILGFPAVNADLEVLIRDNAGTTIKTGRPYLDGTVKFAGLDAGAYTMEVLHPNITLPVIRQPIRVLPVGDTQIQVLIDPTKFRNTPIADIPDANLGPVRDRTQTVSETMLPLSNKQPGEAITAQDWNAMASGIRDISLAVGELTRLVTPTGHDHPELVTKIEEMVQNFSDLLNTLGAAMTELQRQIQNLRVRKQVEDVLNSTTVDDPTRNAFIGVLTQLDNSVSETPTRYGRTARTAGQLLGKQLDDLVTANQTNTEFVDSTQVKNLQRSVDLLKNIRSTTYSGELEQQRNIDRQMGTGGLSDVVIGSRG
jgi:hypothetical protein